MNIFGIPSWYPSKSNPNAGHFILEQVLAIGKYHQETNVIISLWGDEETKLNFEYPGQVLSHLINFFQNKPYRRKIAQSVWGFNQPALEWSARIFRGNINSIIRANKINFQKAQKQFGKIDLIHGHVSFPAGFVAMKLSQEYNIPYIITEHMGPFPLLPFAHNRRLMPLVLEPLKKANQVVTVSSKLQSELLKYKIKSVVIPNLIDENFFTVRPRKQGRKFQLFSLGEITPEKGFKDLIEALAIALKKDDEIFLRIGGRGKFLKRYQKMAKDLEINRHIQWLGFLTKEEVLHQMQACDVFILASHHESFGLVYLEALACGRPVIATRSGGPEDFINDNNGLLVRQRSIKDIATAILEMKKNFHQFNPQKIRKQTLEKYSSKVVARKIFELYRQFI